MKNYLFLAFFLLLVGCNKKNSEAIIDQQFIEPGEYGIMGYHVKEVAYHDSLQVFFAGNPSISIIGDSTLRVTEELGQFLFNGNEFTYKIMDDSLILTDNNQRIACKIVNPSTTFFQLEVDNKYVDRIDLVKPGDSTKSVDHKPSIKF